MDSSDKIKDLVKEKYSEIVNQPLKENLESLCGVGGDESCCGMDYTIFSEDYSKKEGYCKDADLGVGCGIPTDSVTIKEGDYVLDLGSGAGNDCFIARKLVGSTGKVIGLDFTPKMLEKAWKNLDKMKYNNIEFRLGDIENMPVSNDTVDVVISNCVINLVPNKHKAYEEIHRVLKVGGFFAISDVVVTKELPEKIKNDVLLYAGCVGGAMAIDKYLDIIKSFGFEVEIKKTKEVIIPRDILIKFITEEEYNEIMKDNKILSITVVGRKMNKSKDTESLCCEGDICSIKK